MQQQFKRQLMALGVLVEDVIASFCRGTVEVCNYGTTTGPGEARVAAASWRDNASGPASDKQTMRGDASLYCLVFRCSRSASRGRGAELPPSHYHYTCRCKTCKFRFCNRFMNLEN